MVPTFCAYSMKRLSNKFFFPIHRDGFVFGAIFLFISVVSLFFSKAAFVAGAGLTTWCFYFFRDPERVVPQGASLIVSPADGIVTSVMEMELPAALGLSGKVTRVSIFLSVFDVHVNRMPASGVVTKVHYHPGAFVSATLDKSSEQNEKNYCVLKLGRTQKFLVVTQIAGLIARRIVCDVRQGEKVETGDRYGIIRFGSRVDLYLPAGETAQISVGQRVIGGETVIARLGMKNKEFSTKRK